MTETRSVSRDPSRAAWPRILPFALFIVLMAAEPYLGDALEPVLDPRWLYAIRSLVTAIVLALLWRYYVELRRGARTEAEAEAEAGAPTQARTGAGAWATGVVAGIVVFILWILLDFPPLVLGEAEDPYTPMLDGRLHWGLALTRLAGSALVVPVMEELFWRSFLMRWLEKSRFLAVEPRSVGWKPLMISSAIFAVEHRLWFAGLLAGLVYGELYRRTGRLWVVILAHAVTNAALGVYVLATGSWGFW